MIEGGRVTNQPPASASTEQGAFRIYPPLLAGGLLLITLMIPLLLGHSAFALHHLLGLLFVAGGVGLSFFAAALFQTGETTKNPYGEPAVFVSQMPYTFTRNPMYLGLAAALLGFAVFFGSVVMVAAPVIFVATIDRLVIPGEEAAMERRFGEAYREYRARVRRWL
jgi:protein-S-isoprenylcysteine O-methyltransferase Ste14